MNTEAQCPVCEGQGQIEVMREVTREMAMDAGDLSLAGQPIPDNYRCEICDGGGVVYRSDQADCPVCLSGHDRICPFHEPIPGNTDDVPF